MYFLIHSSLDFKSIEPEDDGNIRSGESIDSTISVTTAAVRRLSVLTHPLRIIEDDNSINEVSTIALCWCPAIIEGLLVFIPQLTDLCAR